MENTKRGCREKNKTENKIYFKFSEESGKTAKKKVGRWDKREEIKINWKVPLAAE